MAKRLVYNKRTRTFSEVKSYAVTPNMSIYALFRIDIDDSGYNHATFTGSYRSAYRASELEKPGRTRSTRYRWVQVCNTSKGWITSEIG